MNDKKNDITDFVDEPYKYGFKTNIDSEFAPKGLSEDIIRFISQRKNEPAWLLEYRLKAYRHWLTLKDRKSVV